MARGLTVFSSPARRWSAMAAGFVLALAVAACADSVTPGVGAGSGPLAAVAPATTTAGGTYHRLIECSPVGARAASRVIGPEGGILALAGHAVYFPRGAVSADTRFTLEVPASRYVEIELRAEGSAHYRFEQPVTVTLDYARCGAKADAIPLIEAWYIESGSRKLIQNMWGSNERGRRHLVFGTDHFSGYAIAEARHGADAERQ